jgi:L-ascorbate metabolism protein UlaG (beta-lactamase superfamily)
MQTKPAAPQLQLEQAVLIIRIGGVCSSPFSHPPVLPFPPGEQVAFAPEDIDYVLCTHLHADHVGWNTRLLNGRWVPTFLNARPLPDLSSDEDDIQKLQRTRSLTRRSNRAR